MLVPKKFAFGTKPDLWRNYSLGLKLRVRLKSFSNFIIIRVSSVLKLRPDDQDKTKTQLIEELNGLRQQISEIPKDTKDNLQGECEARFAALLNITEEAIISIEPSQRIILFNKGAEKVFGYSADEVIGKPIDLLIPERYRNRISNHVRKFIDSIIDSRQIEERQEVFAYRKNGEEFPAEASISKLILDDKIILTVILRDISRRKRNEQALRKALAEVEQLKNQLQAENQYLQEEIKTNCSLGEIISQNSVFKKVLYKIEQVAVTSSSVLILGETGTGKELIARTIHNLSKRKTKPLVKVNCSALSASLIESELFGHEKGAFTGAISRKEGRFGLADGGTIFLDEIGDLPLGLQTKLLRVLQEGEFERVGGTKPIKVDVRILAASNRQLRKAVKSGDFREDLFYRLNVIPISLPPLRQRKDDIPLLVKHFCKKYSADLGKKLDVIPEETMSALQAYPWPGNIRELQNIIERAVVLSSGSTLHLGETLLELQHLSVSENKATSLTAITQHHILHTLEVCKWKIDGKNGAAERLGMNPGTLRSKLKKLGIKRPG